MKTAVAPLPAEPEPAPLNEMWIEKGTPAFMKTVLALFSGGFATFALLYCVQPMMPLLSKEFAINAAQSSLVLSVATAMLAFGLLITGPISDRIGRKPVMVFALVCAALSTLASAVMPSWELVLVTRALVGLSLSGLAAVAMTYLSEEIHPQHIGLAMGLYIGGNAIGGMSGRLITGVLIDFVSWHTAMLTIGGLALVAALVFWKVLPESRNFRPQSMNPRSLLDGFVMHFKDAGLPWLFLEAFLLMGAFVTLFNYIGYRLLAEPYHMNQALVGPAVGGVPVWHLQLGAGRRTGGQAGPAQGVLGQYRGDGGRLTDDPGQPAGDGDLRHAGVHLRLLWRALGCQQLDRPPGAEGQGAGLVAVPVQLLRRVERGGYCGRGVLAPVGLEWHRAVHWQLAGGGVAGGVAPEQASTENGLRAIRGFTRE
ncbi:efflux transporter [Pseudomonas monteilii]|uniref:Efflux transporter n=1 Tax=Pseudomonas monteilii TaxID=76759 RepID=A0AAE6V5Q7_9PSED|nr:efflux transporter [Pseudomonas monteilii]